MTVTATKAVIFAIQETINYFGEYFKNTCLQRLEGGLGSFFDGIKTVEEMTDALVNAKWIEATHPNVLPGCKAYKTTDIKGGHYGIVRVSELEEDAVLTAVDPKGTGFAELAIAGVSGMPAKETWLITGEEDGHVIVFTFFPGEPISPSSLAVSQCPVGTILSKQEAEKLGFIYAKVERNQ